jgi:hypothetical protein
MAGTAVVPTDRTASPLNVPETEQIAALLAELVGVSEPRATGAANHLSGDDSTTLQVRKPSSRADRPPTDPRLEPVGHELGRHLAKLFPYPGGSPPERFDAAMKTSFRHLGWGLPALDFGHTDENVVIVQVEPGPGDHLVAGMLAGLLSQLAGLEFSAAAMPAIGDARLFVVGPPDRLEGIRG